MLQTYILTNGARSENRLIPMNLIMRLLSSRLTVLKVTEVRYLITAKERCHLHSPCITSPSKASEHCLLHQEIVETQVYLGRVDKWQTFCQPFLTLYLTLTRVHNYYSMLLSFNIQAKNPQRFILPKQNCSTWPMMINHQKY